MISCNLSVGFASGEDKEIKLHTNILISSLQHFGLYMNVLSMTHCYVDNGCWRLCSVYPINLDLRYSAYTTAVVIDSYCYI